MGEVGCMLNRCIVEEKYSKRHQFCHHQFIQYTRFTIQNSSTSLLGCVGRHFLLWCWRLQVWLWSCCPVDAVTQRAAFLAACIKKEQFSNLSILFSATINICYSVPNVIFISEKMMSPLKDSQSISPSPTLRCCTSTFVSTGSVISLQSDRHSLICVHWLRDGSSEWFHNSTTLW